MYQIKKTFAVSATILFLVKSAVNGFTINPPKAVYHHAAVMSTSLPLAMTSSNKLISPKMDFGRRLSTMKMSAEEEYVNKLITSNSCVVFSATYCPFCTKAKAVLDKEGAKYTLVELDTMDNGNDIKGALASLTGRRTVPNVFIGGKTIGGGDDTVALAQSGELKGLLQSAGAL